jgi:hypothetical protein
MTTARFGATFLWVAATLAMSPAPVHAYLGPGGVITSIGAALALFAALVAAVAGFIWYPLKQVLRWLGPRRGSDPSSAPGGGGGE